MNFALVMFLVQSKPSVVRLRFAALLFALGGACLLPLCFQLCPDPLCRFSALLFGGVALFTAGGMWLYWKWHVDSVFFFASPVLTFLLGLYFFATSLHPSMPQYLEKTLLGLHIAGASMGQLLALTSGILSVLFLWQEKLLKQKNLRHLPPRLPSLESLGEILSASLFIGFLYLTLALISGILYILFFTEYRHVLPQGKILWASLVWGWYLVILLSQRWGHMPTRRIAIMSLVGFCFLALAFFGLAFLFVGEGHGSGL